MCSKFHIVSEEVKVGTKLYRFLNVSKSCCGITRDKFSVEFAPSVWNRKSAEDLENTIDQIWRRNLEQYKIYDAEKFRFGRIETGESGGVRLDLGLTSYKDIVGTTQHDSVGYWLDRGAKECGDSQAFIADGLGVGLLAFSRDNHLLVIRRARWTGVYAGLFDRPGGHPEPDNIFQSNNCESENTNQQSNKLVEEEVWSSPVKELEAETGVEGCLVQNLELMGITRNLHLGGRPSLEFRANINSTGEEIVRKYSAKTHSEADENTDLRLISPQELQTLLENSPDISTADPIKVTDEIQQEDLEPHWDAMTPALRGALLLYKSITFNTHT